MGLGTQVAPLMQVLLTEHGIHAEQFWPPQPFAQVQEYCGKPPAVALL
jgi:hypothetical protein